MGREHVTITNAERPSLPEEMGRLVIASFEARVSSVEQIIESTHEMLETLRSQREAMRAQLRETLARAASLRRRDFDTMMGGILVRQEERERAIKETMRGYLAEQRALAATLREALGKSEAGRIESVKEVLRGITARREEREREVRALLAGFRNEQEEMARALQGLLSNGGAVKVREFKATLRAMQSRSWAGKEERGSDDDNQMRVLRGEGIRSL